MVKMLNEHQQAVAMQWQRTLVFHQTVNRFYGRACPDIYSRTATGAKYLQTEQIPIYFFVPINLFRAFCYF